MKYSPGVISVLPLFYIGWSDAVLSPSEMHAIQKLIAEMDFLDEKDKNLLLNWTDQKNPPSAHVFKSWQEAIKAAATGMPISEKVSLVDLGIKMAQKAAGAQAKIWEAPKVREAIEALEEALGVSHQLSRNSFYQRILPDQSIEIPDFGGFDTQKMQLILDGAFAAEKNRTKNLLMDEYFHLSKEVIAKEDKRAWVLERTKALAAQGFGAYAYPKEFGGEDSPGGNTAIFETLALGNISLLIKFGVQFGLFGGAILQLGSRYHHEKYLTQTGTLELPGCFAMTETGHGSNVRDLQTTATYNHQTKSICVHSPDLNAGKEYIGNALHAKMAVVFAQLIVNNTNYGIHAIMVPLRDENHETLPGITVIDNGYKMGLNGVDNGRIWFDNVEVPVENLLNKYGGIDDNGVYFSSIEKESKRFFTMLGALVGGRVSVALAANTASKKALDIAIRYALKRRQFASLNQGQETLILDYPTHQWRLFPLLAKSYGLTFALEKLRTMFAESYGSADIKLVETLAAGLKSYASWHATDTIQECREACGGKGYLAENELADLKADTDIFTTFEGDNHVLLQLVAKALLTDLKQEFNDGGFMAVAKHVMQRVSTSVSLLNPVNTSNTNADHLLSATFLQAAMEFRYEKLLFSLSDRLRSFVGKKLAAGDIFLRTQTHMIALANAYIEKFICDEYLKVIEKSSTGAETIMLEELYRLFALHAIFEDRGWYLENNFISSDKSKAIRKVLDAQMRKVRPFAGSLVEAFGIPDVLRGAVIAKAV